MKVLEKLGDLNKFLDGHLLRIEKLLENKKDESINLDDKTVQMVIILKINKFTIYKFRNLL